MAILEHELRNLGKTVTTGLSRRLFSVDEYYVLAETGLFNGQRVELIEGEIVKMAPVGPIHGMSTFSVGTVLTKAFTQEHVVIDQASISLQPNITDTEPQPDIVIAGGRRKDYLKKKRTPGDILLLVEVSDSSLDYDRETKAPLYASAGIVEYWIVNLDDWQIEVYREPDGPRYNSQEIYKPGDRVKPLNASGDVDVDELLR